MYKFIPEVNELTSMLKTVGFNVVSFSEGDDLVDSEITISNRIHIQVPFNSSPCIVIEDKGLFTFMPQVKNWKELKQQLKNITNV